MAKVDIRAMAKAADLSDSDIKGKSSSAIMKMISKAYREDQAEIEIEMRKGYIDNANKLLPKVKQSLDQSFEICAIVREDAAPVVVKIVGYISETSEYLVFKGEKSYRIKDDKIIKSMGEFEKPVTKTKSGKKKSN